MTRKQFFAAAAGAILVAAYALMQSGSEPAANAASSVSVDGAETAVFAGGCFWCMEPPFEKLQGVLKVESGYTGGFKKNPTYEQVSHTETGHLEAVRVTFDKSRIRYDDLLKVFWRNVDPTDGGGQFVDRGTSYLSAIFVNGTEQRSAAERSKMALEASSRFDKPIVTPIRQVGTFYLAEDYHQDYYKKNPIRYKYYRYRSGRDQFLDKVWGADRKVKIAKIHQTAMSEPVGRSRVYSKPPLREIRARLTPLQYQVTQEEGTERPFNNEFWDNSETGIFVDVVSGEPLFSSLDKFKSGTGWPSFTRPVDKSNIVEKVDRGLFTTRTEVRSKHGDSHLGHVFDDGPAPTGLRYCINSAALRFIPLKELPTEGYGSLSRLFDSAGK